jgi:hypothetical protein
MVVLKPSFESVVPIGIVLWLIVPGGFPLVSPLVIFNFPFLVVPVSVLWLLWGFWWFCCFWFLLVVGWWFLQLIVGRHHTDSSQAVDLVLNLTLSQLPFDERQKSYALPSHYYSYTHSIQAIASLF